MGDIGIQPDQFWMMSYKEVILAIRGMDARELREWERTRLIAYQVYAGIPKKGTNKPIQSYLPLPSDGAMLGRMGKEEYERKREVFLNKLRVKYNQN